MWCKLDWMTILKVVATTITTTASLLYFGWNYAKAQGIKDYKSQETRAEVKQHRTDIVEIKNDITELKQEVYYQTVSIEQIKQKLNIAPKRIVRASK